MTAVLLVGVGAVGERAARELVETPGIDRVLVTDRRAERAAGVARATGAEVIDWNPSHPVPEDVDAVAAAVPEDDDLAVARAALEAGVAFASAADDHDAITELCACDMDARAAGVTVAAGCGLAPGLSDVLSRHAADQLDETDEVHVARFGAAGPASERVLRRNRSERAREWERGEWAEVRGAGPELVWFAGPIGALDCDLAEGGADLVVRDVAGLERVTFRMAEPRSRSFAQRFARRVTRRGGDEPWGAVRVEVHGTVAGGREMLVYGAVGPVAETVGAVLALSVAHLVGALDLGPRPLPGGVHGLAALIDPVRFLAELSVRGVHCAKFEGVPVS